MQFSVFVYLYSFREFLDFASCLHLSFKLKKIVKSAVFTFPGWVQFGIFISESAWIEH